MISRHRRTKFILRNISMNITDVRTDIVLSFSLSDHFRGKCGKKCTNNIQNDVFRNVCGGTDGSPSAQGNAIQNGSDRGGNTEFPIALQRMKTEQDLPRNVMEDGTCGN